MIKVVLSCTLAYACQSLLVLIFFHHFLHAPSLVAFLRFTSSHAYSSFGSFMLCSYVITTATKAALSLSLTLYRTECMRNNCGRNDTDRVQYTNRRFYQYSLIFMLLVYLLCSLLGFFKLVDVCCGYIFI